jgi:hypothetical protein
VVGIGDHDVGSPSPKANPEVKHGLGGPKAPQDEAIGSQLPGFDHLGPDHPGPEELDEPGRPDQGGRSFGNLVDPGPLGSQAHQDLPGASRGVEFKIEVVEVGLTNVLEVGSVQTEVPEDPIDFDPVE